MIGVLGALEPQKKLAESESGDDNRGSNDVLVTVTKENKGEDELKDKLVK